jgi:hypothetical protein
MDYKRILRITIIILVIAAIAVGGYFLWKWLSSRNSGNLPGTGQAPTTEVVNVGEGGAIGSAINTSEQTASQSSKTVTSKLSIFIDTPVSEYWLNTKDGGVYFSNLAGQIIKINSDGTRQLVSSQTLNDLRSITPSNDGTLVVAEFNYPELPTFSIFSASTTSWQPLPSGTVSATISPDSKKIAYTDKNALNIIDLTTQKTTKAQDMSQVGFNLNWIADQSILLYSDSSIDLAGYVYTFNPATKTLKTIINGEYGSDIKWASDGTLGIKINSVDRIAKLNLIDNFGSKLLSSDFPFLTIPEKCIFAKLSTIYCGIPKNIPSGIALPDDYYSKNYYPVDDIYELNLPTNKITNIFNGNDVPLDAYDLKMKDDNNLLFVNRYDNKVYSLNLE